MYRITGGLLLGEVDPSESRGRMPPNQLVDFFPSYNLHIFSYASQRFPYSEFGGFFRILYLIKQRIREQLSTVLPIGFP